MTHALLLLVQILSKMIMFCFFVVLAAFVPFILSGLWWLFYYYVIKKYRRHKPTTKRPAPKYTAKRSALKRLFIDFPRRFILDWFNKNPDGFDTYGIHVFCGEQGSGKSIAAVHFIKCLKERNPACLVSSNMDLDIADNLITEPDDFIGVNNGEYGQVVVLDEIQNWFSSLESKNFPPDMLTEITQQRKQRKCIVGTAQVFNRISKPIREQITLLYKPTTIAGCLTIVRVYRAHVAQDGSLEQQRIVKMYFFVHDDELRNAYDTYSKVERLQRAGFHNYSEKIS